MRMITRSSRSVIIAHIAFVLSHLCVIATVRAQSFDPVDRKLAAAAAEAKPPATLERAAAIEADLKALAADPAYSKTQADLSTRALIANSLAAIARLEQQQQTLEAVRLIVRTLDFAHSLHEIAKAGSGGGASAAALVDGMWQRLTRTAKADVNARVVYAQGASTAIVRSFVAGDKSVSAWELIGDATAKRARWRETPLGQVPAAELAAIEKQLPAMLRSKDGPTRAPFVLFVGGIVSAAPPSVEPTIAAHAAEQLPAGIVTVAVADDLRPWPMLALPTVAASANADLARAVLVHRASGRILHHWQAPAKPGDVKAILAVAAELVQEASADLRWPAVGAAVKEEDLAAVAPTPQPATAKPVQLAVRAATMAGAKDTDGKVRLTPADVLFIEASLGAWGLYRTPDDQSVWLRKAAVGAYVPPPPPPNPVEATEPAAPAAPAPAKGGKR